MVAEVVNIQWGLVWFQKRFVQPSFEVKIHIEEIHGMNICFNGNLKTFLIKYFNKIKLL